MAPAEGFGFVTLPDQADSPGMALLREHIPYYAEAFELDGFLQDPALTFGFQEVFIAPNYFKDAADFKGLNKLRWLKRVCRERLQAALRLRHPDLRVPKDFHAAHLGLILHRRGVRTVKTLDLFDARADHRHDMNLPLPENLAGRFGTVIDIGSLEHVFDTRTCFANLLALLRPGGHLMLHTPCRGFFDHGLHTLSPECILQALEINGCEIRWLRFSTAAGVPLNSPREAADVILWVIARRNQALSPFIIPQQGRWQPVYEGRSPWLWK